MSNQSSTLAFAAAGAPPALKSIIIWLLTKPVQCFLYCKIYLPIYISCHLLYTWHASYTLCVYKFDMLSVFIVTGWVITLDTLRSLRRCKCFDDTSGLPIGWKPIFTKNRFVTSTCMHDRIYTHISANYSALIPFCNEVLTMWQALFQTSNTLTTTENNNQGNKQQLQI